MWKEEVVQHFGISSLGKTEKIIQNASEYAIIHSSRYCGMSTESENS
jgi:hypothetical protein